MEQDKDMSRLSSYAPLVELRELENHIMARVGLQVRIWTWAMWNDT